MDRDPGDVGAFHGPSSSISNLTNGIITLVESYTLSKVPVNSHLGPLFSSKGDCA